MFSDNFFEIQARGILEKANVMSLTKQISENNRSVKTKVIVSADISVDEVSTEKVGSSDNYFKSQVTD